MVNEEQQLENDQTDYDRNRLSCVILLPGQNWSRLTPEKRTFLFVNASMILGGRLETGLCPAAIQTGGIRSAELKLAGPRVSERPPSGQSTML